ncbi:ankyrin protein [Spatholobus suberectus]|nr:ankyrin protein [Spatholobus suberectus]
MGRQIEIVETNERAFERKMEKAQRAALREDWTAFKKFFEEDKKALLEPMNLDKDTPIHVATSSNRPRLFVELLDMLSVPDRWRALRRRNSRRSTVLHYAAMFADNVEIVDVLLRYDREATPPPDGEIDEAEEKQLPLLEMKNDLGETPLYRAAKSGNIKMLQHMAKSVADIQTHFVRDHEKMPILHIAIVGQHLDVAIWLMKVDDKLADAKDEKELTALQMLSEMPFIFRSCCKLGTTDLLLYSVLPEQYYEYEDYDESVTVVRNGNDLESGKEKKKPPTSGFSRINYAIWNFLAREWDAVGRVWEKKKQHKLAEHLADLLVQKDNSWHRTSNEKQRTVVILPIIKPTNVAQRKKQLNERLKQTEPTQQITRTFSEFTPLLLAASAGIVEIVEKIFEMYPESINHVSENELNVLHVAVMTRQEKIYQIIKSYGALKLLAGRISDQGRSLLHQVARMKFYRGGHVAGYAYELQHELRWYERVKKIIPGT